MQSNSQAPGLRGILGRGGVVTGWLFDVIFGVLVADVVAGIPLGILSLVIGNPAHLLTIAFVAALPFGVRFMRRARAETGPVWFRR